MTPGGDSVIFRSMALTPKRIRRNTPFVLGLWALMAFFLACLPCEGIAMEFGATAAGHGEATHLHAAADPAHAAAARPDGAAHDDACCTVSTCIHCDMPAVSLDKPTSETGKPSLLALFVGHPSLTAAMPNPAPLAQRDPPPPTPDFQKNLRLLI